MATNRKHESATTAAYLAGWRQNDDGSWFRVVLDDVTLRAETPEQAIRMDQDLPGDREV